MFLDFPEDQIASTRPEDAAPQSARGAPDIVVGAGGAEAVVVPGGEALLKGEFLRDGDDLLIACSDGTLVLVEGFFAGGATPDIVVGGAVVPGRIVERLAQDVGEDRSSAGDDILIGGNEEDLLGAASDDAEAEAQQAALPEPAAERQPVAAVTEIEGQVVVLRADGSRVVAETGTPLYEDDVVTTSEGGSVGITFVDGMSFSLGAEARLLLDEFAYDPESHDGGGLLSVLQGQFSFVSGAAAHTAEDALMIETPTMTIGVRGTKVVAQAAAEGEVSRIALLAEEDGTVGKIMVTTDQGSQLISEANMMVEVVSRFEAPSPQVQLSSDQVFDFFKSAISVLPAPAGFFSPERPEIAGQDAAVSGARSLQSGAEGDLGSRSGGQVAADGGLEAATDAAADVTVSPLLQPQAGSGGGESPVSFGPAAFEGLTSTTASVVGMDPTASETRPAGDPAPTTGDGGATGGDAPPAEDLGGGGGALGGPANPAPTVGTPLADQATTEDVAFVFDASTAFSDPGDTLTFSATLIGGAPLPAWLSIDPATGIVSGTPANGDVAVLDLDVTATDSQGQAVGSSFQLTVANANDAPTATPIGNTGATEDSAFNYDVSGAFADVDSVHGDSLSFTAELVGGTPLPAWLSIGAASGVFTGTPGDGDAGLLTVKVTATDGAGASADATFQINVANVNDAPVLDASGSPALTAIAEDTAAPAGDTVAAIVIDGSITDPDGAAVEAIAVTGVDDANGTWEYSTDGGANYSAVGAVSDTAALLLDGAAKLRFVPDADYNGTASLTYRAWDQSSGANGDSGVDTTVGTAFSTASEIAAITVTAVADAPVLDGTVEPVLAAIAEDTAPPVGDTVGSIVVDGSITDPDGAIAEAIAVTGVDDTHGTWTVSTNGGTTFTAIGAVSESAALLLDAAALIRFVPDSDFHGQATFDYKAWDQAVGASGDSGVDTTGGTSFSATSVSASIAVTPVADAPVLDTSGTPTLTSVLQNATSPAGNSVAELVIDGAITDVDGPVAEAIAVTAVDDTNGTWEYSTDGGATFNAFGAVSDSAAVLLDGAAVVRFVPGAGYTGSASLTYKAWDQSVGWNGLTGMDTTAGTAFSTAAEVASVMVLPSNSAPVLDNSGAPALGAIAEDATDTAGDTVADIVIDGSITDADGARESIAVTAVDDANGTWEYSTDGGATFNAIGPVSESSALLLNGAAVIRFVPDAAFTGTATFDYKAWDESVGWNGLSGFDTTGGTAFSAAGETASITVVAESTTLGFANGAEFLVNTETAKEQENASLAALDDGGYVVVWDSKDQDGSNQGVYGQRYDAAGTAIGSEFRINTETSNAQHHPAVSALDGGGFVVVWDSKNQDGHNEGVFGQRFDAAGHSLGAEFQVNTETANKQEDADVAALSGGGFVVTWQSHNQDGDTTGVFGQRFDASGAAAGPEFQVNTTTSKEQENPQVVGLGGGGFVVVWESNGSSFGVFGQRYDATGAALGSEFAINSHTSGNQKNAAVAALDGGGFVVAWQSQSQDGDGQGIYAQRFDAAGNALEFEFQVNGTTAKDQKDPAITALDDGGFLIAWTSTDQDGDSGGIYAQRFNADGDALGGEFRINSTTLKDQKDVDLATLESGGVVAAWQSLDQDGGSYGVYAHQYDSETASVTINAPVAAGADVLAFDGSSSYADLNDNYDAGTGDLTLEAWFHYDGQSGIQTILSKGSGAIEGYNIFLDNGELVVFANPGSIFSSSMAAMKTSLPVDHGWHHVAMVIDQEQGSGASTVTGYLDGSSAGWTVGYGLVGQNSFTTSGDGIDNADDFLIGAADKGLWNDHYFDGEIADVRVWNTARSQAEIQADMSRTLLGSEDHLVANWRLDDGAGTTAANAVAGGLDGSVTGSSAWQDGSSFTMAMDGELDGRITATDAEGDSLTFSVSGNAANGTATIDAATGAWEYTPDGGYTGGDSFSYQISDGNGGAETVNISVVVV